MERFPTPQSKKDFVALLLLSFFFGCFGAHRFYAERITSGLIMFFTLGVFGIWTIIDLILIITGNFKDHKGLPIKN